MYINNQETTLPPTLEQFGLSQFHYNTLSLINNIESCDMLLFWEVDEGERKEDEDGSEYEYEKDD